MPTRNINAVIKNVSKSVSSTNSLKLALASLLFGVKDNFALSTSTAGSKMLQSYESPFEATAISLLRNDSGAHLTSKLNLDEFGMGSANLNSYFGPTLNPRYPSTDNATAHVAGGSSGGSAAAVADNIVDFALGTDTGGSVRLPASYCEVVGFKPSYGRISRWGVIAYAQTLDTVGILARDMEVVERVFEALDHHDPKDPTSLPKNSRRPSQHSKSKLRIGLPQEFLVEELTEQNRDFLESALNHFVQLGHEVVSVSIPLIKHCVLAYYTIATAEAASNLARYDGIRYGFTEEAEEKPRLIIETIEANRTASLGPEVQRRIILGNYTLSSDSGDHYSKATQVRKQLASEFDEIFKLANTLKKSDSNDEITNENGVDLLLCPTSIGGVPTIDEYMKKDQDNFLTSYANDLMTIPASLAGLPSISVPFKGQGMQLIGQFGDDYTVLRGAKLLTKK